MIEQSSNFTKAPFVSAALSRRMYRLAGVASVGHVRARRAAEGCWPWIFAHMSTVFNLYLFDVLGLFGGMATARTACAEDVVADWRAILA